MKITTINKITLALCLITVLTVISRNSSAGAAEDDRLETLQNLEFSNPQIKDIRSDTRKSLYITKGGSTFEVLPKLKFYKYRVMKGDNFWKILSKTSMNIDTLMSINPISSPGDIEPGGTIFIPNMRGIIYNNKNGESIDQVAKTFNVKKEHILSVNNISADAKQHLFIPSGETSSIEKSLFLGTGFASPLRKGRLSSGFGKRRDPFNKSTIQFHKGIDIACPRGTKIHSARSGKVSFTGYREGYGLLVIVQHSHDYFSYYGHLSRILVKKEDTVKAGALLALSGNTGRTTGPHLHFEVRKNSRAINPGFLLSATRN
jgi:murein DD-endopeptidase MepM/ murein hydrolase activator NlpD